MKKYGFLMVGFVGITLASTVPAYASTISSNSSKKTMAWVVHDVTRQNHYQLSYKTKDAQGNWVDKKIVPPTGSLIEVTKEPVSQAVAQGDPFLIATNSKPSSKEVEELHNELDSKLHPNGGKSTPQIPHKSTNNSTISPMSTTGSGTGFDVTGSFSTNDTRLDYGLNYSDLSNGDLALSYFTTWKYSGNSAWQQYIFLFNPGSDISKNGEAAWSYPSKVSPSFSWYNSGLIPTTAGDVYWSGVGGARQGATFKTEVESDDWDGSWYYGYVTLN